jgi:hypothetical protein
LIPTAVSTPRTTMRYSAANHRAFGRQSYRLGVGAGAARVSVSVSVMHKATRAAEQNPYDFLLLETS